MHYKDSFKSSTPKNEQISIFIGLLVVLAMTLPGTFYSLTGGLPPLVWMGLGGISLLCLHQLYILFIPNYFEMEMDELHLTVRRRFLFITIKKRFRLIRLQSIKIQKNAQNNYVLHIIDKADKNYRISVPDEFNRKLFYTRLKKHPLGIKKATSRKK